MAIAKKNNLDEKSFFRLAEDIIHRTGYVTGKVKEKTFWEVLLQESGLQGDHRKLRSEILRRFVLRPQMLTLARRLRDEGIVVAVLSDQTNWLDEINGKKPFFGNFDFVINSYALGKSKRDQSVFKDLPKIIGVTPHLILFVDDSEDNISRAGKAGLRTIHITGLEGFKAELDNLIEQKKPRR